jgi:hypothetical protein
MNNQIIIPPNVKVDSIRVPRINAYTPSFDFEDFLIEIVLIIDQEAGKRDWQWVATDLMTGCDYKRSGFDSYEDARADVISSCDLEECKKKYE